jgi:hypothetical protein
VKITVHPAAAILLIDTKVTPIDGAYRTSLRRIREFECSLLGMLTYMSPLPVAWNVHLSAAVIGTGSTLMKFTNLWKNPDMCRVAPELYKSISPLRVLGEPTR